MIAQPYMTVVEVCVVVSSKSLRAAAPPLMSRRMLKSLLPAATCDYDNEWSFDSLMHSMLRMRTVEATVLLVCADYVQSYVV